MPQELGTLVDPQLGPGSHRALLHHGEPGFLQGTLPFIREGLRGGEPVLAAIAPDRIHALTRALGEDAQGVQFLDIREMGANPARIIPVWLRFVRQASPDGRPVRGIGEPVWPQRSDAELEECERHEALLNLVLARYPQLQLLCPYDLSALDERALEVGQRTHPELLDQLAPRHSQTYLGLESASWPFAGSLPEPQGPVEDFPFGAGQVFEVRDFIARWAQRAKLPTLRRADLEWALSELVDNSLRHGGGRGHVRAWEDTQGLVCEVRDRGQIADPLVGRDWPPGSTAGDRGLWLVNQLCDLVQIRRSDQGTVVRVHVHRTRGAREIGGAALLAQQVTAALDRFTFELERRLSQSDRSLLSRLSAPAQTALLALPDEGLGPGALRQIARRSGLPAREMVSELETAGLADSGAGQRAVPTTQGRRLRDSVARQRRALLGEMLAQVPEGAFRQLSSVLFEAAAV
ncbi:MAG: anti-sigma factor RsbA family regulatory protein [Candidatus Dormibacteria bacterium]